MSKINRINRPECRVIGKEALEALEAVAEKFGLTVKRGRATYAGANATFKFTFNTTDESGEARTPEREDFMQFATIFGLEPEDFGKTFESNGYTYRICGCKPNSPKYNILAERVSGKGKGGVYKFVARRVAIKLHPEKAGQLSRSFAA